jgi:hypothetical protein
MPVKPEAQSFCCNREVARPNGSCYFRFLLADMGLDSLNFRSHAGHRRQASKVLLLAPQSLRLCLAESWSCHRSQDDKVVASSAGIGLHPPLQSSASKI